MCSYQNHWKIITYEQADFDKYLQEATKSADKRFGPQSV